ncbi:MAG: hypothetical protein QM831_37595 [Kofleriaceae bacterium]
MKALGLVVVAVLAATSTARADIGVVVTGEATLQPQLLSHLESWLQRRGHTLKSSALEPDAINTLIDCFVVADLNCAKAVIENRSKAETVVYARVEIAPASDGLRDISIVGYWMQKGHETMAERRACHHCTEKEMHGIADDLMLALASQPPAGSHVHVPPPQTVGQTSGAVAEPPASTETPEGQPSRALPYTMVGIGVGAIIAGAVLIAIDQDPPGVGSDGKATGPQPMTIRDTATAGVITIGAGVVVTGVGAYLWYRSGKSSAPVASVSHDGAVIGWAGRF